MLHVINSIQDRVVYFTDEIKQVDCKSIMFDMMLTLAQDTVECYRSDFYHDAIFLKNLVLDKPTEFYYLFGSSGTTIVHQGESNLSPQALAMSLRKYSREIVYKVELMEVPSWDGKVWKVVFTCLATDKEVLPPYTYLSRKF